MTTAHTTLVSASCATARARLGLGLALGVALALPACMSGGSMRSTMVGPAHGRPRAAAAESRAASGAYARTGGMGSGPGGGGSGGDAMTIDTLSSSAGLYASEPAEGPLGSYGFEDEELTGATPTDDDRYRGETVSLAPAASPPPDAVVARILEGERSGGEAYADAGRVVASAAGVADALAETASDAAPGGGPLLIYTAGIWLAVYEVRESQASIVARAEELGGFVQHQTDTELTLRVPAAQFDALVEAVTSVGDLLHREIAADDVSEEYRDVEIRIRNLEAMRQRLEVLLTQATAVEDALRVERELERVTVELERLRGRQRFLSDRIALGTITVHFEARPRDRIDQPEIFALPFYWLQNLGLPNLLSLH